MGPHTVSQELMDGSRYHRSVPSIGHQTAASLARLAVWLSVTLEHEQQSGFTSTHVDCGTFIQIGSSLD